MGPNVGPPGVRNGPFDTKSESAKKCTPKIKYQEGTDRHKNKFSVDTGIIESDWKQFGVVSLAGLKVLFCSLLINT